MDPFTCQPPLSQATPPPFVQRVDLRQDGKVIASAQWLAGAEAVAQLLALHVEPSHRKQGHGRRLVEEVTRQALAYYRARQDPLRRLWAGVEQKTQIPARALLTGLGFHHVATIQELCRDQDWLIYTKAFD